MGWTLPRTTEDIMYLDALDGLDTTDLDRLDGLDTMLEQEHHKSWRAQQAGYHARHWILAHLIG